MNRRMKERVSHRTNFLGEVHSTGAGRERNGSKLEYHRHAFVYVVPCIRDDIGETKAN